LVLHCANPRIACTDTVYGYKSMQILFSAGMDKIRMLLVYRSKRERYGKELVKTYASIDVKEVISLVRALTSWTPLMLSLAWSPTSPSSPRHRWRCSNYPQPTHQRRPPLYVAHHSFIGSPCEVRVDTSSRTGPRQGSRRPHVQYTGSGNSQRCRSQQSIGPDKLLA
jgi:hypothetical protein